jgi:hypothetical protein
MKTLIHKKSKTVAEKLINNAEIKQFSGNDVMAMLAKLQAQGQPAVENVVEGIVAKKAPSKKPSSKPKTEAVEASAEQITVDGIDYIQITNESGRQFKFGVRKASEILDFVDAIADFVQAHQ